MNNELADSFCAWLDSVLSQPLPENIAAFSLNLYDGSSTYDIELIAAPTYDPNNEDWACDDIFMSERFELPQDIVGNHWEQGLVNVLQLAKLYITRQSAGAKIICSTQAFTVGFVDGNLSTVWLPQ